MKVLGNIVPLNEVAKECPWIQIAGVREGLERAPKATPLSRLRVPLGEEPLCSLLCSELFTHFTYCPHNSHKVCALWTSSHRSGN